MAKKDSQKLKYSRLAEDLRGMILEGKIQAGEQLPSENVLSARYQISRHTVRKALSILENEGYIYAEHGKGTFCSELVRHTKTSRNIAVVTTYLSDYIFPRVIQGIDGVMAENGYTILLKNTRNSRKAEARCLASQAKARFSANMFPCMHVWSSTGFPMCLSRGALPR